MKMKINEAHLSLIHNKYFKIHLQKGSLLWRDVYRDFWDGDYLFGDYFSNKVLVYTSDWVIWWFQYGNHFIFQSSRKICLKHLKQVMQ